MVWKNLEKTREIREHFSEIYEKLDKFQENGLGTQLGKYI